jgi:DNA-binding MarR family transcriptional regulator
MSFDPLVANPGRLSILTALAVEERQEFVDLRSRTRLTDGNLASHAKRLQSGGLIEIDKQFRDNKPVTTFALTADGRKALEGHVRRLMSALSQRRVPGSGEPTDLSPAPVRERAPKRTTVQAATAVAVAEPATDDDHDEWVD